MQTPTLRPLASGDAATAADQGTPNRQLGNGALFTPAVMPPKLNDGTNITNVSTLPYIAVYIGLWQSALFIQESYRMSSASNTMVGLSTAHLLRIYAPPLQAPAGWYMSLWANCVLVPR